MTIKSLWNGITWTIVLTCDPKCKNDVNNNHTTRSSVCLNLVGLPLADNYRIGAQSHRSVRSANHENTTEQTANMKQNSGTKVQVVVSWTRAMLTQVKHSQKSLELIEINNVVVCSFDCFQLVDVYLLSSATRHETTMIIVFSYLIKPSSSLPAPKYKTTRPLMPIVRPAQCEVARDEIQLASGRAGRCGDQLIIITITQFS